MFLNKIWSFILRITLCSFTFHVEGEKIQANRGYDIHCCSRCGNLFGVKKIKQQNKS